MDRNQKIGAVIKRLRKQKPWTQDRLSQETNERLAASFISRIESGQRGSSSQTLEVIAEALGTSVHAILAEAQGDKQQEIVYGHLFPLINWSQLKQTGDVAEELPLYTTEKLPSIVSGSKFCIWLPVTNDSMETGTGISFPDGCRILVDPAAKPAHRNYVIAFAPDYDGPIFRQLIIDGNSITLKALNNSYTNTQGNNIEIWGVVKDISVTNLL